MIKTLALVLKKQNIGETDRILTIFSPTLGKKRVIVRGARKPLSKLAGHLDTFMLSQLILTDQPDLPKVTSAQLNQSFTDIRQSLTLTGWAFAVSRIIDRVIVEDINQQAIFSLTLATLERITRYANWPITWLSFLSGLTDRLGIGVTHFACQQCQQPLQEAATWLPEDRAFICQSCQPADHRGVAVSANGIKLLQLLRRKPFEHLSRIRVPMTVSRQVEEVLLREVADWINKPWTAYGGLINSLSDEG
jgi:DNA repair protein RecO (recombination protein O)